MTRITFSTISNHIYRIYNVLHIIYHREVFHHIISRGSIVGGIILGCRYCDNSFEDATITSDDSGDIKTLNIFNIAVLV